MSDALAVVSVRVRPDRVVCEVRVAPAWRTTTPELARLAQKDRPFLFDHACVNTVGPTFGAVAASTSLPHLFEHVVIDLLVQRAREDTPAGGFAPDGGRRRGARPPFRGTSEWADEDSGRAVVQVSMRDDVESLRAVRDAAAMVNGWCAAVDHGGRDGRTP